MQLPPHLPPQSANAGHATISACQAIGAREFIERAAAVFMPRREIFLSVVLIAGWLAMASRYSAHGDDIRWIDNYREAIQEAKRTGKPVFLEFRCEP
jgi:hypothetical protein